MLYRTLIAFTTAVALGCAPVSALAAGHERGHGGGGRAAAGHAVGGHAVGGYAMSGRTMGSRTQFSGARRFVGGRRVGPGYGGAYYGDGYDGAYYGSGYGCNGYDYDYNGCGYDPGVAIVGGLIGGALNGFGAY
jgi:hypothetical protein